MQHKPGKNPTVVSGVVMRGLATLAGLPKGLSPAKGAPPAMKPPPPAIPAGIKAMRVKLPPMKGK